MTDEFGQRTEDIKIVAVSNVGGLICFDDVKCPLHFRCDGLRKFNEVTVLLVPVWIIFQGISPWQIGQMCFSDHSMMPNPALKCEHIIKSPFIKELKQLLQITGVLTVIIFEKGMPEFIQFWFGAIPGKSGCRCKAQGPYLVVQSG